MSWTIVKTADKKYNLVQSAQRGSQGAKGDTGDSSPKGAYATLAKLQAAYPDGTTGTFVCVGNVAEIDTLTVTGAPISSGNLTITVDGTAKTVAVVAGTAEVASLTISAACTTAGDNTITLNGVATNTALTTAMNTAALVATAIRGTTFTGYTTGGSDATITFTANAVGAKTDATYSAGSTGATGTMTTITQGVDQDTTATVAAKIRATAFTGWNISGSGALSIYTSTTTGARVAPVFSGGTTGVTATFLVTEPGADADGYMYKWNGTAWIALALFQATGIGDGAVNDTNIAAASYLAFKTRMSLNMFDKNRVTHNCYVHYDTGELSGYNASYCVSDFIPVMPGEIYRIVNTNEQMAFYNSNKKYVSGNVRINGLFNDVAIPAGVAYARFSVPAANLNSVLLYNVAEYNAKIWNNSDYTYNSGIVADGLSSMVKANYALTKINTITVKPDGTGDYTTVAAANAACTSGSATNIYNIIIYPGTYTSSIEISLNPYVNLIGTNGEACIIGGVQADTTAPSTIAQYSTINFLGAGDLENLTVNCKNMRYPIHDDTGIADIIRNVKNCTFEHLGNAGARTAQSDTTIWTSECAYGSGVRSGNVQRFKNCKFKSAYTPYYVHNNINFSKPAYVEHESCEYILTTDPLINYALRIDSDGSGTQDKIKFTGCRANAPMLMKDNWLGTTSSDHVDWTIEGHSNDIPFASEYSTGQMDVPRFNDEVRAVKATVDIAQGQCCCWDTKIGQVRVMTSGDDISLFAGIAIETVTSGTQVNLKYAGYMYKKWITTTYSSAIGVLFGVGSDGKIASVTDKAKALLVGMGADTLIFKFL